MRVLIGGEHTGAIRDAFIDLGYDAVSCDIRPCRSPGPHIQCNWEKIEGDGWDLAIFHRTCTFMTRSSAGNLYIDRNKYRGLDTNRWMKLGLDAHAFWLHMQTCPIRFVAWENPIMLGAALSIIGKPDQITQPWWFGTDPAGPDNVKKGTCWWLKNLPPLRPTGSLTGRDARDEIYKAPEKYNAEDRRMARSAFHPGHAAAIATQWGSHVEAMLKRKDGGVDFGRQFDLLGEAPPN